MRRAVVELTRLTGRVSSAEQVLEQARRIGDTELTIKRNLRQAIQFGVPAWNVGDYAGCAAIYTTVARQHEADEPRLERALRKAES